MQSRYYDPEVGRFLNADAVDFIGYSGEVLSYNLFVYCENNAVNRLDFEGENSTSFEKLSNIVALIFLLVLFYETANYYDKYTYYSAEYSGGKVYIIDKKIKDDVISTRNKLYIVDLRDYKKNGKPDPDMQILSSYRVDKKSEQEEVAEILLEYNEKYPKTPAWKRSKKSIVDEWRFHNLAYDMHIKRGQTADTNLNNADEGKGFWDFVTEEYYD